MSIFMQNWPLRLWTMDKHYHYIGGPGGYGVGYGAPAAVGAALANRKHGRLTVNIQHDGDLMFAPGTLWTAAHHRIPLLTVMHNNRAYHQEVMQVQQMALEHGRNATSAHIGTKLDDPPIDFAKLAQSMGVYGEGPIANPEGSRAGDPARDRGRQTRRAGARRRAHAAAMKLIPTWILLAIAVGDVPRGVQPNVERSAKAFALQVEADAVG